MAIISDELAVLFNRNTEDTKHKILLTLHDKPSNSDGIGYVYGFESIYDRNLRDNYWIKLGRTIENDASDRVGKQHGIIVFCQKSSFNKIFERLVHLFFRYTHKIRNTDGVNQIEWFHFTEKTNIVKYIALIQELVEDTYKQSEKYLNNKQISSQEFVSWIKCGKTVKYTKININTASKCELMLLPGIGTALADRIIYYRVRCGRFNLEKDIMNVPYIRNGRYSNIKEFITV